MNILILCEGALVTNEFDGLISLSGIKPILAA